MVGTGFIASRRVLTAERRQRGTSGIHTVGPSHQTISKSAPGCALPFSNISILWAPG